jgi:hypothetical protein
MEAFSFAKLGLGLLGFGHTVLKGIGEWFERRSFLEIAFMAVIAFGLIAHIADHRQIAKLKRRLTICSTALTDTRTAFDKTVANYRAAAAQAAAADKANADRVKAEQSKINQETSSEYEARLAAARAAAQRLRDQLAQAAAHPGSSPTAPVPGVPAAAGGPAQAPGQDGFSVDDRLTATEQAIQLDELIKWVKKQAGIDVNGPPKGSPN